MKTITRLPLCLAALVAWGARPAAAQETATWYVPTYTDQILVWDEASELIVDRIEVEHWIPNQMLLNEARDRLYVRDATGQNVEIVDLKARRVVDSFTLSRGNVSVRIDGITVSPTDDRALLIAKRYTKGRDRYTVEGPFILEYDLRAKQVTDTLDWPDGRERERGANFRYAPDGETLYYFADDVIALDANTYDEIDRWALSQPLEPGLGRPNLSLQANTYDEPGVTTGIFRMTEPVNNRRMLGIAQVRLAEREVEFYTLGTTEPIGNFSLAPGGTRAYALHSEIGHYEFWEFDLAERRLAGRHPFPGRPRMGLQASADGQKLYVHVAGNTIDIYDARTFERLRTVEFDEDMTLGNVVVVPGAATP
jgi:DNA-binding beta-propeller fold protein YncE